MRGEMFSGMNRFENPMMWYSSSVAAVTNAIAALACAFNKKQISLMKQPRGVSHSSRNHEASATAETAVLVSASTTAFSVTVHEIQSTQRLSRLWRERFGLLKCCLL